MDRRKRISKKIGAWLLVLVMVAGLVTAPAKTAEAADVSVDLSVDTSSYSATSATFGENPDTPGEIMAELRFSIPSDYASKGATGYSTLNLEVNVTVNGFTSSSGITAGLYAMNSAWGGWKDTYSDKITTTGQTVTLSLPLTGLTSFGALGLRFTGGTSGTNITYTINSAKLVGTVGSSSSSDEDISSGSTSDEVTAVINKLSGNYDWAEYNYSITNNTDSPISGIQIKIPTDSGDSLQAWGCSATYSDGYIIISHTAVLAAGATYTADSDTKFGVSHVNTFGTPIVEFVYGEDGGGTSSSELKYELTGQTKTVAAADTPVGKHGQLSLATVSGYSAPIIVDKNGEPFQLRGASTHGMHWSEMTPYVNKSAFQSLRDEWGVNMVRLVSYVTQGGYTQGSQSTLDSAIQTGVQAATELGMYAIIDWHIHAENPWDTESSAEAFFKKYAQMYANNNNVIYEICNEPTGVTWYDGSGTDLYSYCKKIATIIRQYDNDALIVCGTNNWSQDVDEVAAKPLKDDGFTNILYTFHFYSGSHYGDKMNKVKTATAAGTPIFVTEFGICDASGNGGYDTANADEWIALCDQYNISYACWSLCNKNESASYLLPSCTKTTGGWTASDLSTTGIWLVNTYRAHEDAENGTDTSMGDFSISVNPAGGILQDVATGYTNPGKAVITVTNTSEKTMEDLSASLALGTNFEIVKNFSSTTLAAGASTTVEIALKEGKTAGTYADTVTIQSGTVKKTQNVKQVITVAATPAAKLEASSTTVTCTAQEYGYTNPAAATVTISNNGTADASGVTAALPTGSNFTITQLPSGSVSAGGTTTITVTPKTGLSAGTYTDTLKVADTSGSEVSVQVTFTVNEKAVTVKADDVSKTYGEENPALNYRITSGEVVSGDSLNITCSTVASKTSAAGSYDITVTAGSNPNYKITTQKGTLTINRKEVTSVTFPTASDITVGQTLASSTLSGINTSYGTFAWKDSTIAPARGTINADVVLTLTEAAKKNYSFSNVTGYDEAAGIITQSVSVNVNRAGLPAITFPTASTIQYGQTLSQSALTGGSTAYGSFKWADGTTTMTTIGSQSYDVVFEWNAESKSKYGILDSDEDATLTKKVTVQVEKADNTTTPAKAILSSRSSNSITVQSVSGYEYSKDGKTWQDSNVFTGLSSFTGYKLYTRIKETTTHKASAISDVLTVYTLAANPYTIDVSKLSDVNYVDALRTEEGNPTVSYDTNTKILTLSDSSKTYIITGSNSSVTVKTNTGSTETITLSNATIKALDVTNTSNATVTVTGTSKVTDSICADGTSVTLNGSGTLNVGAITASNGTVNIESGTVNAASITAQDINIKGGTVTVSGAITAANNISIIGGTVTANGGISAGNNIVISSSTTKVTAAGSDGNPAISGNGITITDATVTATGGSGAAAIKSNSDITITDATVIATGGEGASAIESGGNITIEGESTRITANTEGDSDNAAISVGADGTITIKSGSVTSNNSNMYSNTPKDADGNDINTCTVTIGEDDKTVNIGDKITLQAEEKKGYTVSWKDEEGNTYEDGKEVTINGSITFTAIYEAIKVTSISVTASAKELEVGKTATVKATVSPADALDTSVTWSSSNTAVATVSSSGIITAKAKGTATITATAKDGSKVSRSVIITVKEAGNTGINTEATVVKATSIVLTAKVKGISSVPVTATYKLAPKKTMTLKVAFAPANAETETVTFKSSNTKVATVNSKGKITAKKAGTATITVTSENGLKKSFKVKVMKKAVSKVKITASKKIIKVKKTVKLKATTSPSKKSASNLVYWKSSKPSVATVSATGKVKGIKKGKAKITAIAKDGSGKKATIIITVK